MRFVVRRVRFPDGREDSVCVPASAAIGEQVETASEGPATVIDDRASPRRAPSIGFPALGGRCYMNGGYVSEAWGVDATPEAIAAAKQQTPEWDFDEKGRAIIPSEAAMKSGVAKIRATDGEQ